MQSISLRTESSLKPFSNRISEWLLNLLAFYTQKIRILISSTVCWKGRTNYSFPLVTTNSPIHVFSIAFHPRYVLFVRDICSKIFTSTQLSISSVNVNSKLYISLIFAISRPTLISLFPLPEPTLYSTKAFHCLAQPLLLYLRRSNSSFISLRSIRAIPPAISYFDELNSKFLLNPSCRSIESDIRHSSSLIHRSVYIGLVATSAKDVISKCELSNRLEKWLSGTGTASDRLSFGRNDRITSFCLLNTFHPWETLKSSSVQNIAQLRTCLPLFPIFPLNDLFSEPLQYSIYVAAAVVALFRASSLLIDVHRHIT